MLDVRWARLPLMFDRLELVDGNDPQVQRTPLEWILECVFVHAKWHTIPAHRAMEANDVRVEIYSGFIERARPPMPVDIATKLGVEIEEVEAALRRLHDDDVIVLAPGTHFVWLAHPFSAQASPFRVRARDRLWDAICIWDALGIFAVLEAPGTMTTSCPDCGEPLELKVEDGQLATSDYIVHHGVPARRWYEDVGYT
jgi:Alkylmercury lyase